MPLEPKPMFTSPLQVVICCECRGYLEKVENFHGKFDAIITDPPFNIGQVYDVCDDRRSEIAYADWFAGWFCHATQCLRPGGVFAINVPDDLVELTLRQAKLNGLHRIDWIIWHYKFGQCHNHSFISSHTHCLVFQTDFEHSLHTWNPDAVLVESDRDSKYGDTRTAHSATPGKRVPLDVWSVDNDGPNWSRIVGANIEKVADHPNQLPEKYLERLIRSYTNVDDLILEPFGGTGTTAVVADALKRRCVTLELSRQYCVDIVARLKKGAVRLPYGSQ